MRRRRADRSRRWGEDSSVVGPHVVLQVKPGTKVPRWLRSQRSGEYFIPGQGFVCDRGRNTVIAIPEHNIFIELRSSTIENVEVYAAEISRLLQRRAGKGFLSQGIQPDPLPSAVYGSPQRGERVRRNHPRRLLRG